TLRILVRLIVTRYLAQTAHQGKTLVGIFLGHGINVQLKPVLWLLGNEFLHMYMNVLPANNCRSGETCCYLMNLMRGGPEKMRDREKLKRSFPGGGLEVKGKQDAEVPASCPVVATFWPTHTTDIKRQRHLAPGCECGSLPLPCKGRFFRRRSCRWTHS